MKLTLKQRIFNWVKENHDEYVDIKAIKQTNITFRKASYRCNYYFSCGNFLSLYTMKRWIEIAENKLYDSWDTKHGNWYWLKNNHVIN